MKIIILILVSFNLCAQNIERSTINLYDHEIKIPLLKKENQRDKNFLANFYAITALPDNIKAERNSIDIMLKEDSVFSKFFNELNYQKYKCTSFSKENSYVESSGYKFNRLIVNCDDGNEIMMESYIYNKASDFKDRIVEIQKDNINNTLLEMSYYKNGIVKSKGVTMRKYLEFPVGNWYFYNEDGSVKKMINADNQYRLKIENVLRILKKHKIVLPFNNDQMQTGEATYIKIKTAINRYLKTNYGALWKIEFSEWKNSNKDDLIYHIIIIEDKTGKILANEKLENADEIVKYWEEGETKKIKIIFLNYSEKGYYKNSIYEKDKKNNPQTSKSRLFLKQGNTDIFFSNTGYNYLYMYAYKDGKLIEKTLLSFIDHTMGFIDDFVDNTYVNYNNDTSTLIYNFEINKDKEREIVLKQKYLNNKLIEERNYKKDFKISKEHMLKKMSENFYNEAVKNILQEQKLKYMQSLGVKTLEEPQNTEIEERIKEKIKEVQKELKTAIEIKDDFYKEIIIDRDYNQENKPIYVLRFQNWRINIDAVTNKVLFIKYVVLRD